MNKSGIVVAVLMLNGNDRKILIAAQARAHQLKVPWHAVYLETPYDREEDHLTQRNSVLEQLALAERMGAVTHYRKVRKLEDGVLNLFEEREAINTPITHIIIADDTHLRRWYINRSLSDKFTKLCEGRCKIELVALQAPNKQQSWFSRFYSGEVTFNQILGSLLAVLLAFITTELLRMLLPYEAFAPSTTNEFLIYLLACSIVAVGYGLIPGLIASVASFLMIKVFYVEPLYEFRIVNLSDGLSLGLFLLTSVVLSFINSRVHVSTEEVEARERRMSGLLQVYKIVSHARTHNEALQVLHDKLQQFFNAQTGFFLPSVMQPDTLQRAWPEHKMLDEMEKKELQEHWKKINEGSTASYSTRSGWRFEPMITLHGPIGMLAIKESKPTVDPGFDDYLRRVADLVASILEKIELVHMTEESRVRAEREKLRTMLLSSVSHDLKTPLAAIIGSLGLHQSIFHKLTEDQRNDLTTTALTEAQRLDSFIKNILDLAKIESGAVQFKLEWHNPQDILQRLRKRMQSRLSQHTLNIVPPRHPMEVEMDAIMTENALLNVLDNAVKYTPAGSAIHVNMEADEDGFIIRVRDHGPGIPEGEGERIFDKYTRLQQRDNKEAGTGLGLAVARAIMEGQHGTIYVRNHQDGGAIFVLRWPHWQPVSLKKAGANTGSA